MDRFSSQQFSFPPVHVIPSMLIIELHPTVVLTGQTDKAWEPSFGNRAAPDTEVLSLSINVYSNYALVKFQRGHPEGEGVELPGCSPAHNRNFKNLKIFRHDIKRFT
jgi:hypothetical protein